MNQPNILVLMCDQMQHNRMGCANGLSYTPNLDQLAAEGTRFTHAIAQHGQCVPARAVFMTGQSAHECGVMMNYGFHDHQNMLTPKHHTLPKATRENGYRSVYFGKGHLGRPEDSILETLGIDEGKIYDHVELSDGEAARNGIAHVPPKMRQDYLAAWHAADFLDRYESDGRPLFFTFSTNLPHPPFFTEKKFENLFPPEKMELPPSFVGETFASKPDFIRAHAEDGVHGFESAEAFRQTSAQYETMISTMDEHMGLIIDRFKNLGLWENTLVLFIADHGEMMGAHRIFKKGPLPYDELYRIPCIFKLPKGVPSKRRVIDDLICSSSLPGTLLKLAGLPVPESFTGGESTRSFEIENHPESEAVFFEHYGAYWGIHPFRAIRTRRQKLVHYYDENLFEFYDLERDPHELDGCADRAEDQPVIQDLRRRLDDWWRHTGGCDADHYQSESFRSNSHNMEDMEDRCAPLKTK
jgi:choline-sulfatase